MKSSCVNQVNFVTPLLFNSVVDYWFDSLIEEDAIKVGAMEVRHLAFTDDIVVFSHTTGSQSRVELLSTRFTQCELSIKSSKYKTLNVKLL